MGRIEHFMQYPLQVQQQVFQNLLSAAQYTEFGKQYGFSKIFKTRRI